MNNKSIQSWALFIPELKSLLCSKEYAVLKKMLREIHPVDMAEGWFNFAADEKLILFKLLDTRRAVEVFEDLDFSDQYFLLENSEEQSATDVLHEMTTDEKAKLFKKLSPRIKKKFFSLLKKEDASRVQEVMDYPDGSAGKVMHARFITLQPDTTAKQSLEHIQKIARLHRAEALHAFYITDKDNILLGGITLRKLVGSPPDIKVSEIMTPVAVIKIDPYASQEEAARMFSKYDISIAPVVDSRNHLIGVIVVDDIIDIINREATEDITKMAGTGPEDLTTGSVTKVICLRMPWLFATWIGGLITSSIISFFEPTMSRILAIAAFIPVIAGMGGNVGTQSSTIVVRGLATGEIDIRQVWKMVYRELRVGVFLGFLYGLMLGTIANIIHSGRFTLKFGFVIGLGIFTSMSIAATLGALLPMVFKRLNIDPAVATAPFVSTATDIISIFTYLAFAAMLF